MPPTFRSHVSTSQERWSLPAERRQALAAGVVALAVFGAAWAMLHRGFYRRDQIVDTPVYQRYGDAMLDGQVPYLDFRVEYPPVALPVFLLPAIGDGHDERTYRRNFERLMVLCGLLAIVASRSRFPPCAWSRSVSSPRSASRRSPRSRSAP